MLPWRLWSLVFILIQVCSLQLNRGWAEPPKSADERPIVTLTPVVTEGLENPLFLTQAGDGSWKGAHYFLLLFSTLQNRFSLGESVVCWASRFILITVEMDVSSSITRGSRTARLSWPSTGVGQ